MISITNLGTKSQDEDEVHNKDAAWHTLYYKFFNKKLKNKKSRQKQKHVRLLMSGWAPVVFLNVHDDVEYNLSRPEIRNRYLVSGARKG